ncbi:MAG: hypothetical protein J6X60_08285 [Ruminiclostridium sp.]|nr:hypothetical protein [Ruminiclostridium sp.]
MKKPAKGNHGEFPPEEEILGTDAVSATECTGLIPTGSVDSAAEYEASRRIVKYGTPRGGTNKKRNA